MAKRKIQRTVNDMHSIKSPVLTYEALQYTSRKLTERSERELEPLHAEIVDSSAPMKPLGVSTNNASTNTVRTVDSYQKLLELVAQIASLNPNYQLYYRGQTNNWVTNGGLDKNLRPGIWRNARNRRALEPYRATLEERAYSLTSALVGMSGDSGMLSEVYIDRLKKEPLVRWALLQHYGICDTPLLDITRSLHVACTFARLGAEYGVGYVYVLALPYQSELISTSDGEGLTVMSLLGVTPPTARRPLNQDGYLVTTSDWWRYVMGAHEDYTLNGIERANYFKRVLTVFRIPANDGGKFYEGSGLSDLSSDWLCPKDDEFEHMLKIAGFETKSW